MLHPHGIQRNETVNNQQQTTTTRMAEECCEDTKKFNLRQKRYRLHIINVILGDAK